MDISNVLISLGLDGSGDNALIDASLVHGYMRLRDYEVMGAVYVAVTDLAIARKIDPPIKRGYIFDFLLNYWELCLIDDPKGDWVCSRYEAGHDLANWFSLNWGDGPLPEHAALKLLLKNLIVNNKNECRRGVIDSALEHIFERPDHAEFFSDWTHDPTLSSAMNEAFEWANSPR